MSRQWTSAEIVTLRTLASHIPDPKSPKWREHLPRKSADQIAGMMKLVAPTPKEDAEKEIIRTFRQWEAMGYSASRAYRLYLSGKKKKA